MPGRGQFVPQARTRWDGEGGPPTSNEQSPPEPISTAHLHQVGCSSLRSVGLGRLFHLSGSSYLLGSSSSRQENSVRFLVGLLTGSNAACRLQAVRCLLELSHSHHSSVAAACVPSTPYLLTYLSGQSTRFTVSIHVRPRVCDY